MKVYVVTSGCYSDYGIEKVFLDKKKAKQFVKYRNGYDSWREYRIEEYDTFDEDYKADEKGNVWRKVEVKMLITSLDDKVYTSTRLETKSILTDYEVFNQAKNDREYYLDEIIEKHYPKLILTVTKWFHVTDEEDDCDEMQCEMKAESIAEDLAGYVCELLGQGYDTDQINKLGLRGE